MLNFQLCKLRTELADIPQPALGRLAGQGQELRFLRAIPLDPDIALSRYSLAYAQTDILRTKAGGAFRGIHPNLFGGVTAFSGGGFARRDFGLWLAGDSGGPLDWDSGRLIGLARGAAEALTGR